MDQKKRQTLQGAVGGAALLLANLSPADAAAAESDLITLVNMLTCDPANQAALLDLLRENTNSVITTLDGWRSTSFVAAQDGTRVIIISQWRDLTAVRAMQSDARMKVYFPRIAALAAFDSTAGTIAYARHA